MKGKLERWHLTLRQGFLSELDMDRVRDIFDLNARLWAWLEECYHKVPFELVGQTVKLVVDPHRQKVLGVESQTGEPLGKATTLDLIANSRRKRRSAATEAVEVHNATGVNVVELALETQRRLLCVEMPEGEV